MNKIILRRVVIVLLASVVNSMVLRPAKANETNLQLNLGPTFYYMGFSAEENHVIFVESESCLRVTGSTCNIALGSAGGNDGVIATSGIYTITSSSWSLFTLTMNSNGSFVLDQTSPIFFSYQDSSVLNYQMEGTLQFLSFAAVPGSSDEATLTGIFTRTTASFPFTSEFGGPTSPIKLTLLFNSSFPAVVAGQTAAIARIDQPSAITPVPEPSTLSLLGSGLVGLCFLVLWRNRLPLPFVP